MPDLTSITARGSEASEIESVCRAPDKAGDHVLAIKQYQPTELDARVGTMILGGPRQSSTAHARMAIARMQRIAGFQSRLAMHIDTMIS